MVEYLKEKAEEHNIHLSDEEIGKFMLYKDLLVSYNNDVNLTAIMDDKEIILKHFIDSLTLMPFLNEKNSVIDVGTGAGFPGIPLKIVNRNIRLTLLDSLNKRIVFLEKVISELNLKDVTCLHQRAETAGASSLLREGFDAAVSRAVAPLAVLGEYCLPLVKTGGIFLAMKGGNVQDEIREAENAVNVLGGEITGLSSFCLEENIHARTIIVISKIRQTPERFPRRTGKPMRSPL